MEIYAHKQHSFFPYEKYNDIYISIYIPLRVATT
jgi:hypothetical protein